MIRLSLLTIALFASTVQAAYTWRMPLENKLGGSLPDNSLSWVGSTNGGAVGGGSGGAGNGEGDSGSGSEPVPEEPTEKTPAELCNEKAEAAKNLFASSYNDVFYVSHKIGQSKNWFTGVTTEGCILTFSSPKNKTTTCTGKTAYTDSISPKLLEGGIGIMKVEFQYYGTCS
ncbi:MAG: hypothetical protein ACN6PK_05940 [Pseudomonas shirazensis]